MAYSQWIRTTTRHRIYERDDFRCLWCRKDLRFSSPFDRSLDHILPRSKGGSNKANNLVTCCRTCNDARSDMTAVLFAYEIAGHHLNTERPGRLVSRRAGVILARILDAVCADLPAQRTIVYDRHLADTEGPGCR